MPDQKEAPYRDLDTRKLLGLIQDWFPEPELQNFVLVRNPAELYGFM